MISTMSSSQMDSSLFNSSLGVDANYESCLDYLPSFARDRLFPDSITIEIPELPALESFGWTTHTHIISGEYRISFPDIYVLHTLNIVRSMLFIDFKMQLSLSTLSHVFLLRYFSSFSKRDCYVLS